MNIKDFLFAPPKDHYDSPSLRVGNVLKLVIPVFLIILLLLMSYTIISPQRVGVKISLGSIDPRPQGSGFVWKRPIFDSYIQMPISVNSVQVTESTASADIQEVTTKLSIQYRLNPLKAPEVYEKYGTQPSAWEATQLTPILLEELKATTADWTAEQLIQERPLVMQELWDHLTSRFDPLGFTVVTVNIEDMQFSSKFTQAIEDKVVATQESLAEKNKVEIVRYQQIQSVLAKQGEANRTIIAAKANAEQVRIAAEADYYQRHLEAEVAAFKILAEYNATARGIYLITQSIDSDYLTYEMIQQWEGRVPLIVGENGNLFLDVRSLLSNP